MPDAEKRKRGRPRKSGLVPASAAAGDPLPWPGKEQATDEQLRIWEAYGPKEKKRRGRQAQNHETRWLVYAAAVDETQRQQPSLSERAAILEVAARATPDLQTTEQIEAFRMFYRRLKNGR